MVGIWAGLVYLGTLPEPLLLDNRKIFLNSATLKDHLAKVIDQFKI
jgi:hypothetical protein